MANALASLSAHMNASQGDSLIFFSLYVGSGPASTVHPLPKKILGILSTSK